MRRNVGIDNVEVLGMERGVKVEMAKNDRIFEARIFGMESHHPVILQP